MISPKMLMMAYVLVAAAKTKAHPTSGLAQAKTAESTKENTTPAPNDWEQKLEMMTHNWKIIVGNYGILARELKKRSYDMKNFKSWIPAALNAGEACYDVNMRPFYDHTIPFSETMEMKVKEDLKVGLEQYPDGDWNIRLVTKVRATIENYTKNDPYMVAYAMGQAFVSLVCIRQKMEEQAVTYPVEKAEEANKEGKCSNLERCVDHIYQGLIRGYYGPSCNDSSPKFWERCQPYCVTFENQASE